MAGFARPADFSHASELLEVARTIVERDHDQDLIEKIALLQGYLDLSQMHSEEDHGPVLRRAISEVTAAVHNRFGAPGAALDSNEEQQIL